MAFMLRVPEILIGIGIVAYILNDLFQSVVVPRPTPARYRPTRWVIRPGWRLWRALGLGTRWADSRGRTRGTFAPLIVVVLLVLGVSGVVPGFGLLVAG